MSEETEAISLGPGRSAVALVAPPEVGGDELVARLHLPAPRGTLVVNGGTAELSADLADRLAVALEQGVASVAIADGLTVITGGTDAGIFSILGRAMEARVAPLVGVVPRGLVTWPGQDPQDGLEAEDDKEDLEPHHSHFVLVEGNHWGSETPALLALASALGACAPSAAILCGGGAGARAEVIGHSNAGRPIVVVDGSGRFADDLAGAASSGGSDDAEVATMVKRGNVSVCRLSDGPEALAAALRAALR